MAYECDHCGKGVQYGHTLQHRRGVAGGRWKRKAQKKKRVWLPNLHSAKVIENGKIVRRRLCTKCLRRAERPHKTKAEQAEQQPTSSPKRTAKTADKKETKNASTRTSSKKKTTKTKNA